MKRTGVPLLAKRVLSGEGDWLSTYYVCGTELAAFWQPVHCRRRLNGSLNGLDSQSSQIDTSLRMWKFLSAFDPTGYHCHSLLNDLPAPHGDRHIGDPIFPDADRHKSDLWQNVYCKFGDEMKWEETRQDENVSFNKRVILISCLNNKTLKNLVLCFLNCGSWIGLWLTCHARACDMHLLTHTPSP